MRAICVVDEMDSSGGLRSKNLHNGNNIPTLIPKSRMNTQICPDCGQPYDSSAAACPDCGCPNDQRTPAEPTATPQQPATSTSCAQGAASPQPVATTTQVVQVNFDLGAHLSQFATYFYECALLGWHCLSRRLCNFGGRASRREYWSYNLIITPCLVLASFIALSGGGFIILFRLISHLCTGYIYPDYYEYGMANPFAGVCLFLVPVTLMLMLIVSLHGLSVSVRRMHDAGKSGWWVLVPFASFFLLFKKGDEEWNIYGEPPVDDI